MNTLVASCLGYLTAQMTLIHASLPPAAVAPALNERLGVLRVEAELRKGMDESVWGELRAAVQSFVREYALAGVSSRGLLPVPCSPQEPHWCLKICIQPSSDARE